MILKINHRSRYSFESPVFFEPHRIYLKPISKSHSKILEHKLDVFPNPDGIANTSDSERNELTLAWFSGEYTELMVTSQVEIQLSEYNPFWFLIHPANFSIFPFEYSAEDKGLLNPCLNAIEIAKELLEFGQLILKESGGDSFLFLKSLTDKIFKEFTVVYREKGHPMEPELTFKSKEGSCRDLSWMQIQLLRNMGLASRFTSGYFYFPKENNFYDLHAWVEVFIPGAGWVGFDPSHGILTTQNHIPICSSAIPENTLPIAGSIRGDASSNLITEVLIDQID